MQIASRGSSLLGRCAALSRTCQLRSFPVSVSLSAFQFSLRCSSSTNVMDRKTRRKFENRPQAKQIKPPPMPSTSTPQFQNVPNSRPIVSKPAEPVVREIVEKFAAAGKTMVLPLGDEQAMHSIVYPFQMLLDEGVESSFLVDICTQREELFRAIAKSGPSFFKVLTSIKSVTDMSYEKVLEFSADWAEDLARMTSQDIDERLRVFLWRGVEAGKQIRKVIQECPAVLFDSSPQKMDEALEGMSNFFSARDIRLMCRFTPQVCLMPFKELELRYEYIYYQMGLVASDFVECRSWFELSLEEIMMRHEVLKKTGKYIRPSEKRPQLKMENPPLQDILDTNDEEFAGVAGIPLEEWVFFQQLYKKMEEDEDKERPYDKISLSVRRVFERRAKKKGEQKSVDPVEGEFPGY